MDPLDEEVWMKRKQLLSNFRRLAAALALTGIVILPAACNAVTAEDGTITVMNPAVTEKLAERAPLAPRLESLKGKTLYLVDMNYEGIDGTPVMGEMQAWFEKNMPEVKTVLKLKSGSYISDDPALWKEIAENGGDGVIMGVAG
jgi:hypothetical protein